MASLITPQFERYVAEQSIAHGTVQFDEFIFANIPGLNENNLAQYLTMPTSAQIVHRQAVSQSGVINENAVVYSVTIGTEVGDFDFNFIGLINRSKNLLAVAVQTDTVKKIRNKNAVQGNSITRNILLEFSGAKALTGINVNANTWQIDFTVRLHGLDEKIRLTNRDLYGRAVFFDDSFLVKRKTGNQFTIQPGTAYVEGIRMDLGAEHHLTANSLPCSIYADVVHHCTVTGEYQTEIKYLTQSKADYVDTANRQHYVQILADIDSQGNVTDRRLLSPFLGMNPLTLDDTTENTKDKLGHTHKLPIASLVKKGIVKLFSGYDSDAEDMAATPKAIKGLKALIDAITRNLGNYIPNSKKSSAVNSNSEDTVANSKAAKIAYDKGVEAKTAADNANNNANGRVSKSGDTMTGSLTIARASKFYKVGSYDWGKFIDLSGDAVIGNDKCVIGFNNNGVLHLGGKPDSSEFNASIDETRLWVKGDVVTKIGASLNNAFMKTGGVVTGSTSFKQGDWSGIDFYNNSGRYARIESNPHSSNNMVSFIYRESNGSNINIASLPRKNGNILLDADFTYQKIGNFEVRKYPDGTMIQTYAVNVGEHQLTTGKLKTFNWAVAFASTPMIWVTANATDNRNGAQVDLGALVGIVLSDCTQATCAYRTSEIWQDRNHNPTMQFLAIGRWK